MNKTTNKGYKVDFTEKTITITKAYAAKAGIYGTIEFNEFNAVRNANPDFRIVYKTISQNKNKISYEGLSVEKMSAFIQMNFGNDAAVEFEKYVAVYDGEKGKYPIIKKLFLAKYKDAYNNLSAEEMAELDALVKTNKAA